MTDSRSQAAPRDGLLRGTITNESVDMMRARIGFPNPTLRTGLVDWPWNEVTTEDAIRRYSHGCGDGNPLFTDPGYASASRWGGLIAPPGFEWTLGQDCSPQPTAELHEATGRALRGVQLFNAGHEGWFLRPLSAGDRLRRSTVVADVQSKDSEFNGRSVLVTNESRWTDDAGATVAVRRPWYIHVERRAASSDSKYADEALASYTDDELAEIEAAYDAEFVRGSQTLYYEDVTPGEELPTMVKGPLTITDLINFFMGAGWYGYGFPALRLAHENRKRLRGFYSRNEFNAWDTIMRIHWDTAAARQIGVQATYDIGPVRWAWLVHYCTNFVGDDGWVLRVRGEFRRFNYIGDTTWIRGTVKSKRIDPDAGPVIELALSGVNQRGVENIRGDATLMVPSRRSGAIAVPAPETCAPPAPARWR